MYYVQGDIVNGLKLRSTCIGMNSNLNKEEDNNLFDQVFKTWLEPAIVKKIKSEKLEGYTIPSVMAVVFPHENNKTPYVLLGKECGTTLTKNVARKELIPNQEVTTKDVGPPKEFELPTNIPPNDGYILLIGYDKQWHIIFNLQKAKKSVQEKLERVIAFMNSTESALRDCNIFGFIDNLYAAAELLGEIMMIIVKQGNITIPRIHPKKFDLYQDHVNRKQLTGGDFIDVYRRLLELKNNSRYGDESMIIDFGQLKKDYHITKITLDAIEPKAIRYFEFNGKLS